MGILKKSIIKLDLSKGQEQFFDDKATPAPLISEIRNMEQKKAGALSKTFGFEKKTPLYAHTSPSALTEVNDVIDDKGTLCLIDSDIAICKQNLEDKFKQNKYVNAPFSIDPNSIFPLYKTEDAGDKFSSTRSYVNSQAFKIVSALEKPGGNTDDSNTYNIYVYDDKNNIIFFKKYENKSSRAFCVAGYSTGFYFICGNRSGHINTSNGGAVFTEYTTTNGFINDLFIDNNNPTKIYFTIGAGITGPQLLKQSNFDYTGQITITDISASGHYFDKFAARLCVYNNVSYILLYSSTKPKTTAVKLYSVNLNTLAVSILPVVLTNTSSSANISNEKEYNVTPIVLVSASYIYSATNIETSIFEYNFLNNTINFLIYKNGYQQAFYVNKIPLINSQIHGNQRLDVLSEISNFCLSLNQGSSFSDIYYAQNKYFIIFSDLDNCYIAEIENKKYFENKLHNNQIMYFENGKSIQCSNGNTEVYPTFLFYVSIAGVNTGGSSKFEDGVTYNLKPVLRYGDTVLFNPETNLISFSYAIGLSIDAVDVVVNCAYSDPSATSDEDLYVDWYIKKSSDSVYRYTQSSLLLPANLSTYRIYYNPEYLTNDVLDVTLETRNQCFSFIKKLGQRIFCGVGKSVRYSNLIFGDEGVNFVRGYLKAIYHPNNKNFIQIERMDEKIILFSEDGIYVSIGDGLNDDGTGQDYSSPQKISENVIKNKFSIVKCSGGILCACIGGNYFLDRGLQLSLISGEYNNGTNNITPTDSCYNIRKEQAYFFTSNNGIFVYDEKLKIFSKETHLASRGCISGLDLYTCTGADAFYYKQNTNYMNGSSAKTVYLSSAWIKLNDISGFGRIYKIIFHCKSNHKHKYNIKLYYNYNDSVSESHDFTQTKDGEDFIIEIYSNVQKCEAFKFIFEEDSLTQNQITGDSLQIYGIDFIIGKKPSENKVSSVERG